MTSTPRLIGEEDFVASIADALQYIAVYHPASFIRALPRVTPVRKARPLATRSPRSSSIPAWRPSGDGLSVRTPASSTCSSKSAWAPASTATALSPTWSTKPCGKPTPIRTILCGRPSCATRCSIAPTQATTRPAVVHFDMVAGDRVTVTVAPKGGGSENKAKFANLTPAASVTDWVVKTVETLGAGWCPPGLLGIGVGGSAEKAVSIAKEALLKPIDMSDLLRRGPASPLEEMRIEIYDKVNALGIGAQGPGGLTTVVDVKIRSFPCHAASKPVGLIPQCAADRHITFSLDGSGPGNALTPPDLSLWPESAHGRPHSPSSPGGPRSSNLPTRSPDGQPAKRCSPRVAC